MVNTQSCTGSRPLRTADHVDSGERRDQAVKRTGAGPAAGVIPSWASGLATAEDQIHMMSPNQPGWGPYDRGVINLVHEFAHCVLIHLNRTIPNVGKTALATPTAVALSSARRVFISGLLSDPTTTSTNPWTSI